ncbi:hypothetical protein [Salinithrix halophila]|uniref:Uncharacterized protein n=1 Tax=Salinithrix halophila TaxID=1485204 RepID=A0ABV8JGJ3_9BACL
MNEFANTEVEQVLQGAKQAAEFVRMAQNTADSELIQQAGSQLDQAQAQVEAYMAQKGASEELEEVLEQLGRSRYNLNLSASISNPAWYEPY